MLMIKSLRTKLMIGLLPLLALMVGLGLWATIMFLRLGGNIDVILRENYKSILAAEGMKESLERMDSALLFAIGGEETQAHEQFARYKPVFDKNLEIERGNVTLPSEGEMVDELASLHDRYYELTSRFFAFEPDQKADRIRLYFTQILPVFNQIKNRADDVLNLNQRNMEREDARARKAAHHSARLMIGALVISAFVASLIAVVLSQSILIPVRAITESTRAMTRGNYDQLVPTSSHDEIGELANAFNSMARTIREFQQAGTAKLLRAQATAQATIDSFPDPVIVLDPTGAVERVNPAAVRIFGVCANPDTSIPWTAPVAVQPAISEVLSGLPDHLPNSFDHAISLRDGGQERYFLPRVLAIRDSSAGLIGAALVLSDVTKFRLVDQLKNDMVATVSHELKTPLTSIQMAVHLLLEEVVGPLTTKQIELLLAARQESDRLLAMVNDLLDLTRIEQGRVRLELKRIGAADLVRETVERFESRAEDLGITLKGYTSSDLPIVKVDPDRIEHVFANLVANALEHTPRGGEVSLIATAEGQDVQFQVIDTGEGIEPEHLPRIFEKFYRVPGSRASGGAGLGLAIVHEIVIAHGGRIEASSHSGQGTTFTINLPASSRTESDVS